MASFLNRVFTFLFHNQSLLGAHQGGSNPVEPRRRRTKLDSVASFYSVQDPLRHI